MLDDLTPYYQAADVVAVAPARKIIEFLCDRRHPVPVKEIAQRCFITHQTASGQLKDLREKGYVTSEAIGRESFYELREVLMRFCLEAEEATRGNHSVIRGLFAPLVLEAGTARTFGSVVIGRDVAGTVSRKRIRASGFKGNQS
jgi:DNA-binding transcriptional ArsR family regulator